MAKRGKNNRTDKNNEAFNKWLSLLKIIGTLERGRLRSPSDRWDSQRGKKMMMKNLYTRIDDSMREVVNQSGPQIIIQSATPT